MFSVTSLLSGEGTQFGNETTPTLRLAGLALFPSVSDEIEVQGDGLSRWNQFGQELVGLIRCRLCRDQTQSLGNP